MGGCFCSSIYDRIFFIYRYRRTHTRIRILLGIQTDTQKYYLRMYAAQQITENKEKPWCGTLTDIQWKYRQIKFTEIFTLTERAHTSRKHSKMKQEVREHYCKLL
jgi:hypothetical protein